MHGCVARWSLNTLHFGIIENLYSPNNKQYKQIKSNNYSTEKKRLKLTSNLDTGLAHNTLGMEKSNSLDNTFTVSLLLLVVLKEYSLECSESVIKV